MKPLYATVEAVKNAGNINGPAETARLLRILDARTTSFQRWLGRHFYPTLETRLFDWPTADASAYAIVLNADLLEVISLVSASVEISNFFEYPQSGPPFSRIEIDLAHGEAFSAGGSWQNQIAVEGVWGFCRDTDSIGALVESVNDTVLTIKVPDASLVGIGDLLKIDDEQMIVARRSLIEVGTALSAGVDGEESTRVIPLDDASKVHAGEIITIDAERLLIEDIAGNNAICTRSVDGSLLAEHMSAATVYAARELVVERGAVGTLPAEHSADTDIGRNVPPGLITELCIAETLAAREQELSGYGRETGQGDGAFELRGIGLSDLRKRVDLRYARNGGTRKAAI